MISNSRLLIKISTFPQNNIAKCLVYSTREALAIQQNSDSHWADNSLYTKKVMCQNSSQLLTGDKVSKQF